MPKPGDSCDSNGEIAYDVDGSVLVCRAKRWQRVAEPPPNTSGVSLRNEGPRDDDERG
jgi:hypothetical protein